MYPFVIFALMLILSAVSSPVAAAEAKVDAATALLCVPIEITQCDTGGKCYHGTAEAVNLPHFIKVNVREKMLSGVGKSAQRTTPIEFMQRENGRLVLQGKGENGRAWTAVISEKTGKLSAAVAEEGAAFIIFGACTQF